MICSQFWFEHLFFQKVMLIS